MVELNIQSVDVSETKLDLPEAKAMLSVDDALKEEVWKQQHMFIYLNDW